MQPKANKIQWFKFYPQDWIEVLAMDSRSAGKRFKDMITRLGKNEAPENTPEYSMIAEAEDYKQKRREAIAARWNAVRNEGHVDREPNSNPPPRPRIPPTPPAPQNRTRRPPELGVVYDFCDERKYPSTYGREWYEWQEKKGWNTLKKPWQVALAAFCEKKLKTDN